MPRVRLGITHQRRGKALPDGQALIPSVVDNAQFLVDERSRAGLDVPHAWIDNGMVSREI
ncbi:hypothetical protein D3C77_321180 [compost metagenome]